MSDLVLTSVSGAILTLKKYCRFFWGLNINLSELRCIQVWFNLYFGSIYIKDGLDYFYPALANEIEQLKTLMEG